jgi:hypothetical protein
MKLAGLPTDELQMEQPGFLADSRPPTGLHKRLHALLTKKM